MSSTPTPPVQDDSPPHPRAAGSLLRAAGVVGGLTFASRILGLLRDILLAAFFYGRVLDAFFLAFTIPNLFRRLFGEGALSAAFVPVFVERLKGGKKTGRRAA